MKYVLIIALLPLSLFGQDLQEGLGSVVDDVTPQEELFAATGPRVDWGPPPKFFVYSYNYYGKTDLSFTPETAGHPGGTAQVDHMDEVLAKIKFPFLIRDHVNFFGGLQYNYQRYTFAQEDLNNIVFRDLNERKFEQVRFDTYVNVTLSGKRFLGFKTGVQLSGDYDNNQSSFANFARVQHMGMLGKRFSEKLAAGGAYFLSYQPGRLTVYPALYFTYWKNKKIGFETIFPALIDLYVHPWKKTFFTFSTRLRSNRFLLNAAPFQLGQKRTFLLNTTDVQLSMEVQQRIYDFFWLGFSAGYNFNVSHRIAESQRRDAPILFNGKQGIGNFFQFSAYLSVPEKLLNRKKLEEKP